MNNFTILKEYYFNDEFLQARIFYILLQNKSVKIINCPVNWDTRQCYSHIFKQLKEN
jgi:hypothetical protein